MQMQSMKMKERLFRSVSKATHSLLPPPADDTNDIILSWKDINVSVKQKTWFARKRANESIHILHNVSGYCKSGALTAVMGASGAGKTTLLATVSQRANSSHEGQLLLNGCHVPPHHLVDMSGFVPQHDLVFHTLTVNQHMQFMARLLMDRATREFARSRRIANLLSEFNLMHCANTRLSQLSGGEMKRITLAVQLLPDPAILFCDEPTTGLDTYSAGVVLEQLRDCANRGKAVLATVHQPSSGHFDFFDDVILLAAGHVAYFGPVSDAQSYFSSVGLSCPVNYNPAEFYVQQLAVVIGNEDKCAVRNKRICDAYASSARYAEVEKIISSKYRSCNGQWQRNGIFSTKKVATVGLHQEEVREPKFVRRKVLFLTQLYLLMWRTSIDLQQNFSHLVVHFFIRNVAAAVLTALAHREAAGRINQEAIQNLEGLFYNTIVQSILFSSSRVLNEFPSEINIFLRETADRRYSAASYFLSKVVFIMANSAIEGFFYACCVYTIAGLDGGVSFFANFVLSTVAAGITGSALGTLFSAAFESSTTAAQVLVPVDQIGLILSGIYVQLNGLPAGVSWLKYLSAFYYGVESMSIAKWSKITNIECSEDVTLPCIRTGTGVLSKYGYDQDNYYMDFMGLSGLCIAANMAAFMALLLRSRKSAVY